MVIRRVGSRGLERSVWGFGVVDLEGFGAALEEGGAYTWSAVVLVLTGLSVCGTVRLTDVGSVYVSCSIFVGGF